MLLLILILILLLLLINKDVKKNKNKNNNNKYTKEDYFQVDSDNSVFDNDVLYSVLKPRAPPEYYNRQSCYTAPLRRYLKDYYNSYNYYYPRPSDDYFFTRYT